ncbi:MAG TPA: hypothetical protein VJI69_09065, partial [Bacteroidia bacterium]|nr:hypothetical protein [Bacteroidia bacterium]
LSKDGETLYFMSDMPGGFGKTDIYYSEKNEGNKWTKPKNAGKNVNTFGHELFPYISSDNILYFSSTAHPGMGQLDIFRSTFIDNTWQQVENLKPPFNSIGNDFGICFDESNARGLLSSDRFNGAGAEDIYSFANETPLELSFSADSIRIKNTFLFDDIKYKLIVDDTVESELPNQNITIAFNLSNNKRYILAVKKNGLTVNKIEMALSKDSVSGSFAFQIKTNMLPIRLSGQCAIEQTAGQPLHLSDDSGQLSEPVPIDAFGKFTLKEELAPELLYKLTPTINK